MEREFYGREKATRRQKEAQPPDSLSLEEALSLCPLDREGAPSLFISVSFV